MKPHRNKPTRREFLRLAVASPLILSEFAKDAIAADEASPPGHPRFANLNEWLTPFRRDNNLPALAGAMMRNGVVRASGAVGVRKAGDATPVTMLDKFHLGSCTKAMTATLAAMLVERQQIHWNSALTLGQHGAESSVDCMLEDQEGHLWLGTVDGLFQLRPRLIRAVTVKDGLPHNECWSVWVLGFAAEIVDS